MVAKLVKQPITYLVNTTRTVNHVLPFFKVMLLKIHRQLEKSFSPEKPLSMRPSMTTRRGRRQIQHQFPDQIRLQPE
jgi:hypothetical protein